MSREAVAEVIEPPTILAYAPRDRARALVRAAFPKRKWRIVIVRDVTDFKAQLRKSLVDAVFVDIGSAAAATSAGGEAGPGGGSIGIATDDTWKIGSLAHEYPSSPFFWNQPDARD